MYLSYSIYCFKIMQLGFQYFPWYFPITSLTELLHFNTIIVGVGKVRKFRAHVDIIKVNLMKFIAKCYK